jgi:mRNA-degrading endonuclease HigB of HigAB toxin-antitoxin module
VTSTVLEGENRELHLSGKDLHYRGRSVVVFNIAHNRCRLIAAIHFNTRIVYTLMILTHDDASAVDPLSDGRARHE